MLSLGHNELNHTGIMACDYIDVKQMDVIIDHLTHWSLGSTYGISELGHH